MDPAKLNQDDLRAVRRRLLAWYRREARDLPWRRRANDPFAVWLAEMMLQQTQAATVIPYYEAFLARFPTVTDLAAADRAEVLRLWAGLGYYRRAHMLHEAARKVVDVHAGQFPQTVDGLSELPGVGRYTAGAIASIAFGTRAPILDGNVKRVLARLTCSPRPPDAPDELRRLWDLAEAILPQRACGDFNQALMDLGATVCTPRQPECGRCPIADVCRAHRRGSAHEIPRPRKRATVRSLDLICLVIIAGDRVLLRLREPGGLWGGTWALPAIESNGTEIERVGMNLLPQVIWRKALSLVQIGRVRHQLTHRTVIFHVHAATCAYARVPAEFRWLSKKRLSELPTAFRKVARLAQDEIEKADVLLLQGKLER